MSAPHDSSSLPASRPPRGFIYFCEERLQYDRGFRAWLFWVPYLAGAILLEPNFIRAGGSPGDWRSWLPLLGFLVLFPPLAQALLRRFGVWRRRRLSGLETPSE